MVELSYQTRRKGTDCAKYGVMDYILYSISNIQQSVSALFCVAITDRPVNAEEGWFVDVCKNTLSQRSAIPQQNSNDQSRIHIQCFSNHWAKTLALVANAVLCSYY